MKIIIQSIKNYFKSKKDRGLEPVFFEKIGDQKTSRDQMRKNLIKALEFAEKYYPLTDKEMNLIIHSCKTILTHKSQTWEKTNSDQLFNVSMGSFNGAEICDLIGLFLLNEIKKSKIFIDNEFGLYINDGLANHRDQLKTPLDI